ncbi:heme NO-binding domain-containing protein [Pontibacter virosus]|uniref:Heme-NO-binding protein n=1 Tax=Pontibacter virosus TaxID=1765052 RepID=A0A2U1B3G7_9BACT|nr:heme NO-binding domain-containing protein [Pontibacter virosus]PVY43141.1 heme-NO-binding protein [Pontibacter virosus]
MKNEADAFHLMHGSMFVMLQHYVESAYDHGTWVKLLEGAGVEHTSFQMQEMYPTHEIFAIVGRLGESTGQSIFNLMEQFGKFMVPDLMRMYSRYVRPEWRTYEMLIHTEDKMHAAVRREDSRTSPPKLIITKKGANQLVIEYKSKRRMAGVAVGIIKGISRYFNESDKVEVMLLSPADAERVQIKVDFLS